MTLGLMLIGDWGLQVSAWSPFLAQPPGTGPRFKEDAIGAAPGWEKEAQSWQGGVGKWEALGLKLPHTTGAEGEQGCTASQDFPIGSQLFPPSPAGVPRGARRAGQKKKKGNVLWGFHCFSLLNKLRMSVCVPRAWGTLMCTPCPLAETVFFLWDGGAPLEHPTEPSVLPSWEEPRQTQKLLLLLQLVRGGERPFLPFAPVTLCMRGSVQGLLPPLGRSLPTPYSSG